MSCITTIALKKETRDALAKLCSKDTTFDEIVQRLLKYKSEFVEK